MNTLVVFQVPLEGSVKDPLEGSLEDPLEDSVKDPVEGSFDEREHFAEINGLYLNETITEEEYQFAMTGFVKHLGEDKMEKVFAHSTPCPHFYQEYPGSEQEFTHMCQFCGDDFILEKK
jgi:hypothetical protein